VRKLQGAFDEAAVKRDLELAMRGGGRDVEQRAGW
jgi:hypothetical protein